MIKDIAIVGGGTAGLVAALILRSRYPLLKIDILESDKIGIVGVGEGSTEHWKEFMTECHIDLSELIKKTDATFKYGINFVNWHGDGSNYFHSVSSNFSLESQTQHKIGYAIMIANGMPPKSLVNSYVEKNMHFMPYWGVNQYHFHTFKLNEFLHELCEKRNINIIKTEIEKVVENDFGIDHLISSNGETFSYDFYVDSTGFHRLLLGKTLGVKWKSYQKYLPMDSAIAFPTPGFDEIPSWTLAKALSSGWNWQIPTQGRNGNGYVFSSAFLDFDQAEDEIRRLYGLDIEIAKKIKFEAGCLETAWKKNCAAVGLSYSFVEPLEASSIGSTILQSILLANQLSGFIPTHNNKTIIDTFNQKCDQMMENILEFVALHYITKRNDSEFWKFVKTLPKPDGLADKLERFQHVFPSTADFPYNHLMFKESNWIMVLHALELLPKSVAEDCCNLVSENVRKSLTHNLQRQITETAAAIDNKEYLLHRDALKWLVDNPESQY